MTSRRIVRQARPAAAARRAELARIIVTGSVIAALGYLALVLALALGGPPS